MKVLKLTGKDIVIERPIDDQPRQTRWSGKGCWLGAMYLRWLLGCNLPSPLIPSFVRLFLKPCRATLISRCPIGGDERPYKRRTKVDETQTSSHHFGPA
jgi:hypothetical protein